MTNYILGKELLESWKIKPFELFHHVKDGLQPHNKFGKPQSPPDIALKLNRLNDLRKESNLSIFDCLRLSPEELKSRFESCRDKDDSFKLAVLGPIIESERRKPRYEQITREIEILENDLAKIENKYSWRDYELPEDTSRAEWVINSLLNAYYKLPEAAEIEKKYSIEGLQAKQGEESKCEEFVRKLRVWVECDTDINLKPFKRQKRTFSHAAMGFHYRTSDQWKALLEIINDGKFGCGEAANLGRGKTRDRVKFYDQSQKLLQIINKKILAFLTKTYKIEFPKKYKIFEQLPEDPPRVYRPKFQTDKHQREDNLEEAD